MFSKTPTNFFSIMNEVKIATSGLGVQFQRSNPGISND